VQIEGAARGPVQQVGGLGELGPQRVEGHVGGAASERRCRRAPAAPRRRASLEPPVVALGQQAVLAPHGVVERVLAHRLLHVAVEHLDGGERRLQRVHPRVGRAAVAHLHVDVERVRALTGRAAVAPATRG